MSNTSRTVILSLRSRQHLDSIARKLKVTKSEALRRILANALTKYPKEVCDKNFKRCAPRYSKVSFNFILPSELDKALQKTAALNKISVGLIAADGINEAYDLLCRKPSRHKNPPDNPRAARKASPLRFEKPDGYLVGLEF